MTGVQALVRLRLTHRFHQPHYLRYLKQLRLMLAVQPMSATVMAFQAVTTSTTSSTTTLCSLTQHLQLMMQSTGKMMASTLWPLVRWVMRIIIISAGWDQATQISLEVTLHCSVTREWQWKTSPRVRSETAGGWHPASRSLNTQTESSRFSWTEVHLRKECILYNFGHSTYQLQLQLTICCQCQTDTLMEHLTHFTLQSDQTALYGAQSWRKPLRNSTETTHVSSVETQ